MFMLFFGFALDSLAGLILVTQYTKLEDLDVPSTYIKTRDDNLCLEFQHWGNGHGQIPGAHWPASLI